MFLPSVIQADFESISLKFQLLTKPEKPNFCDNRNIRATGNKSMFKHTCSNCCCKQTLIPLWRLRRMPEDVTIFCTISLQDISAMLEYRDRNSIGLPTSDGCIIRRS